MEYMKLSDLRPHEAHARIYVPGETLSLEENIKRNEGKLNHPIDVTPDGVILGGVRRHIALTNLGYTEAPVNILTLSEDDQVEYILDDNLQRVKIWLEVRNEVKEKRAVIGKKQGRRPDTTDAEKINTQKEIAQALGIMPNVVRVLEMIGDKPEHIEILSRDMQKNSINSIEETYKRRLEAAEEVYDDEFPVVDLKPKRCCTCGGIPPRIISDYVNNTLSYENDKDHCNYM
jgi:hypothetical protein